MKEVAGSGPGVGDALELTREQEEKKKESGRGSVKDNRAIC